MTMGNDLLKINLLVFTVSGFLMLLTGLGLFVFRDEVAKNLRFFLPIPPIGVAAYIFVFNMFNYYDGNIPGNAPDTFRELISGTVILSLVFFVFVVVIAAATQYLKGVL